MPYILHNQRIHPGVSANRGVNATRKQAVIMQNIQRDKITARRNGEANGTDRRYRADCYWRYDVRRNRNFADSRSGICATCKIASRAIAASRAGLNNSR